MDCSVCGKKIATVFLGKVKGTYIKKDGKKQGVCFECQKRFPKKEDLLIQVK